jgi:uncharacterized protein RhaS with RHS repeats
VLGRPVWLSRDPIGERGPDGPNLYAYVRNNPINYYDEDGQFANVAIGAATSVASGWLIAKLTGDCYGASDALKDAAAGAVGAGLVSKLNKLYRIAKLRNIAKARGLSNAGQKGYVETWKNGSNQFERLNIKFEAGKSPNLQAGSKVPRFDYRVDAGKYWNPFTGETGPAGALSHVPLEPFIPGVSAAVGAAAGAAMSGSPCDCK